MAYIQYLLCSALFYTIITAAPDKIPVPQEYIPKLAEVALNCTAKAPIDPETLQKFFQSQFDNTEAVKKFVYCFSTSSGYADAQGHFKVDKMMKLVESHKSADEYKSVIEECNKVEGSDHPDTMLLTVKCFAEKSPILFTLSL